MEDDDFDPLDVLDEGPADMPDYFEEPLPLPLHRFVCPPTPSVECNETSMQPRDLVFVFFLKEDNWMKEQSSDIRAECEIDELFECLAPGSNKNGSESEWVVKQPTQGKFGGKEQQCSGDPLAAAGFLFSCIGTVQPF